MSYYVLTQLIQTVVKNLTTQYNNIFSFNIIHTVSSLFCIDNVFRQCITRGFVCSVGIQSAHCLTSTTLLMFKTNNVRRHLHTSAGLRMANASQTQQRMFCIPNGGVFTRYSKQAVAYTYCTTTHTVKQITLNVALRSKEITN